MVYLWRRILISFTESYVGWLINPTKEVHSIFTNSRVFLLAHAALFIYFQEDFISVSCRYQEILTDPSYAGQFVLMTNPHIGNTGVNFGVCQPYLTCMPLDYYYFLFL